MRERRGRNPTNRLEIGGECILRRRIEKTNAGTEVLGETLKE